MGITRNALLVASPNVAPTLPGAQLDVENFKAFLTSNAGGAWEAHEIVTLLDPTLSKLRSSLTAMQAYDYAFITFSGHGYHVSNGAQSDTKIWLTANEGCAVYEINPRNKRHFVVIDSCRGIVAADILEERQNAILAFSARAFATRASMRAAFDKAVIEAEEGRVVAYSCGINQGAGENPRLGGIFSSALMGEAGRWAIRATPNSILSVATAMDSAQQVTYERNAPQRPELEAGRRLRHFPFAVGT